MTADAYMRGLAVLVPHAACVVRSDPTSGEVVAVDWYDERPRPTDEEILAAAEQE